MALTVRIQKRRGDFFLDVDFTAESGGVLALLGASGCGKTSSLYFSISIIFSFLAYSTSYSGHF